MTPNLDQCAEDLRTSVTSARQAGEYQNISQSLNFLANTLQIVAKAKKLAKEIECLSQIASGFILADSIPTSAIDEFIETIWSKFLVGDFSLPSEKNASDISDQVCIKAYQLGEQAWVPFRDAYLVGVNLKMDLPNADLLHIIDPNLTVPPLFDTWKSLLQRFVGKSFKTLWEECDRTAESFVNQQVCNLEDWVKKITETVKPIMEAISGLPPAVNSALEEALSAEGTLLSKLDDPDMSEWISKNPRVKDLLVIRFRQSRI